MLAARPAIQAAADAGHDAAVSAPIYLGDALRLRFHAGDLFAEHEVRIEVEDEQNTALVFPVSLVERAGDFDALMSDVAEAVEKGDDPTLALDDHDITDAHERPMLERTIATMQRLHAEGRNHIWAYYTRNLVRPVALSRAKVDVIIGNPPWLSYRNTASTLRAELERQSKDRYGIWAGGQYANRQDVASLFFARCTDLYLKDDGVIGMVMPHSALQTGQHAKWRTGSWHGDRNTNQLAVDFGYKTAWDLEGLEPNSFFPVPASVVFAKRLVAGDTVRPLASKAERWLGKAGAPDVRRVSIAITDTSGSGESPYTRRARQGATIVPRSLFFVHETENPAIVQAGQTVTVNPRRGSQDKRPWRNLDLTAISGQTVETQHLYNVQLGETLVPYVTLEPLKAVLPLRRIDGEMPLDPDGIGGISLGGLERRMRGRWRTINSLWEVNKSPSNKLSLAGRLDYHRDLSVQFEWRRNPGDRPFRIVYTQAGQPTAALLQDNEVIVDTRLYWVACRDIREAHYLIAIVNSEILYAAAIQLMSKGQFGARDLHKQLWKLSIPEFDRDSAAHVSIAAAGETAAAGVARELARLRAERDRVTVTIARRELRKWLRSSAEGQAVEDTVSKLLA